MGKAAVQQNRNRTTQATAWQQLRITLPSGVEMAGPTNPDINGYLNQIFQSWTALAGNYGSPAPPARSGGLSAQGREKLSRLMKRRHAERLRQQQQAAGTQSRTQARPKTMAAGGSQ